MKKSYIINLDVNSDSRGSLVAIENQKNIPFCIKRVFYIYGVPGLNVERGNHKNKNTKHMLIALNGSCKVECIVENNKDTYILNSPNRALYIDDGVAKKIYNFSKDCILLCLCSEYYDAMEYETVL